MALQELEQHVIDEIRAAGRVSQIYPDKGRPGIIRLEVDGRSYLVTVAEDFEEEPFAEA